MNTPQEFAELLRALRRLQADGFAGGAALATITRTRGSTFRRPGARMLVCGDGTVVRGLSGGCPERDIILRAQRVIAAGVPEIARYDRESGFDVLVEMGCGGELEVLIEPTAAAADLAFIDAIERFAGDRTAGYLATVFACDGACIAPRPRRLVWTDDAIVHDGVFDSALSAALRAAVPTGNGAAARASAQRFASAAGSVDVLIELLQPPPAIVLVGINATSLALARLAVQLGWSTTLVDHREEASSSPPPAAANLVVAAPDLLRERVALDRHTSVVVMTHNIERDLAYLGVLRDAPIAYLGAIGSRERAARMHASTGLPPSQLRAPAGLDIGSETPEEIALAIAAEIVAAGAGRDGRPLSLADRPIH